MKLKAAIKQMISKKEDGQAMLLVLILVMMASLVIAPLLNYMGTGIKADSVYASRANSLYAVDTGVKDAIWQLENGHYVPTQGGGATTPPAITANGMTESTSISWFDSTPTYKIVTTTAKTTVTSYVVVNIGSPIFNKAIIASGNIQFNAGNATITGDIFSQTGQVIFPNSGSNTLHGNVYAPEGIPSGGKGTITGTVEVNSGSTVSSGVSNGGVSTGVQNFTFPSSKMSTLDSQVDQYTFNVSTHPDPTPDPPPVSGPVTLSNVGSSSNPYVYPAGSDPNQKEYYVSGNLSFTNGNYITFNEPVYVSQDMSIAGNPHIVFSEGLHVEGNLTISSNSLQEFGGTLYVGGNLISNGRVQADDAVYVGGALTLTNGAYIYNSTAIANSYNKVIVVDGAISMSGGTSLGDTDQIPLIIDLSTSPINITLTNGANVEAYIYSPQANVTMDGNASLTGAVVANSFTLGSGSGSPQVTYYPPPANRPDLQQFNGSGSSTGGTSILSYIIGNSGGGSGGSGTTVTVTSSPNPSSSGQSVTFTANVSGSSGTPTGKVTFYDGSIPLGNGTLSSSNATFATSALSVGSHSITGVYSGDSKYAGATSSALAQTVNGLSTSTSVSSTPNPSTYNQTVTFTATVAPGTASGTVTFYDGATQLGTGTLNGSGNATYSTSALSIGSHSITASYVGDTIYNGSSSSALNQNVTGGATLTSISSLPNPSAFGQSVTFNATVIGSGGTPTGTVTFKDGSNTLGATSLNGSGIATYSSASLATGSHSITGVYSGDSNYLGSTSGALTQTVNPPAPTVTTVSPTFGSTTGATTVTITGTGFYGGGSSSAVIAVKFGNNNATSYTVSSDTSISAVTPAGSAGTVNVVVTTSGGSGTLTNGYLYVSAQFTAVTKITDSHASSATTVSPVGGSYPTQTLTIVANPQNGNYTSTINVSIKNISSQSIKVLGVTSNSGGFTVTYGGVLLGSTSIAAGNTNTTGTIKVSGSGTSPFTVVITYKLN